MGNIDENQESDESNDTFTVDLEKAEKGSSQWRLNVARKIKTLTNGPEYNYKNKALISEIWLFPSTDYALSNFEYEIRVEKEPNSGKWVSVYLSNKGEYTRENVRNMFNAKEGTKTPSENHLYDERVDDVLEEIYNELFPEEEQKGLRATIKARLKKLGIIN